MRKLYEIRNDLAEVLEGYTETTEGVELPDIHSIEMEAVEKIKACIWKCNELQSQKIAAQVKLDYVKKYIADIDKAIERIEADVILTMEIAGIDGIKDEDLKLTILKPSQKLYIEDEEAIPEEYFITIPASIKLDKKTLLADAKKGEIAGVKLVPSKVSLRYDKPKKA